MRNSVKIKALYSKSILPQFYSLIIKPIIQYGELIPHFSSFAKKFELILFRKYTPIVTHLLRNNCLFTDRELYIYELLNFVIKLNKKNAHIYIFLSFFLLNPDQLIQQGL